MDKIQHTHCCYCRRRFCDPGANAKLSKTKDHFIAISRSGKNGENILEACKECNNWKADKAPESWLREVSACERKNKIRGTYSKVDYRQIIGSLKHWIKFFKGKEISEYRF